MAAKFRIFCDEQSQQADEKRSLAPSAPAQAPKLLDVKREPLGLRQTASHAISLAQASQQQQHQQTMASAVSHNNNNLPLSSQQNETNLNSTSTTTNSADEEDQENDISMASLGSDFVPSILNDNDYDDDANYDVDQSFEIDEEEDIDADHELKLELSKAFKEHDESQLFKNTPYIDDIKSYLFNLERQPDLRPLPNYIELQDDIDSKKRAILIKWLVEVCDEYDLESETLFIAIGIIDRFLSKMAIPTCNFQLLGVAAMFIASKYEEIYPPNLYQFIELTEESYSGSQIRQMEQEILKALDFRIAVPTITYFLRQIFAFNKFNKKVYDLAEYLCYLSLVIDQPFLEYYPSEIAMAAVILAAHQYDAKASISSDLWNAYDKSNTDQLNRRHDPATISSSPPTDNKRTNSTPTKKSKLPAREVDRRICIVDKNLPLCIEALLAIQKKAHSNLTTALEDSSVTMDDSVIQKFLTPAHNSVALLTPPQDEDSLLSLHNRD